jgi:hypothetical protein
MDRSAFKMGSYGAGALWCLKEREGKFITFNNLRIARQEKDGTWMAVEPGWSVTKTGPVDVRVQRDGREGVVLPFRVGMRGGCLLKELARDRRPQSLIRRTASSLNSRVNLRRSMTHLRSHKNT